ncbi:HEPN domain-containing protein [Desulfonatronum thioautotrophicum]|uniref:HEPN domain-containing protein n=1 Tax=Desulfonatronum thioautotrophicum TaxID=617001 RepID=UPI0005EB163C|nr:HEPN domain-containing protein [Desulfonatronum thioautotrophicum]
MDTNEQIAYWHRSAFRDWEAAEDLFGSGRNMHALFFAHLAVEKLFKAHWVKENPGVLPPSTHNLGIIAERLQLQLPPQFKDELQVITTWNLEARYQDYKDRFYRLCTHEYTTRKMSIVEELLRWLTEAL